MCRCVYIVVFDVCSRRCDGRLTVRTSDPDTGCVTTLHHLLIDNVCHNSLLSSGRRVCDIAD